jgi:hypothetical protein
MTNVQTFIRQCLLALALAGAALGALAGPINFHVDLDTRTLSGNGLISLSFTKLVGAGPVTAKVTNLTGPVGGVAATGAVSGDASGFTIANGPDADNFADIDAPFGGLFSFDIAFSGAFMDEVGLQTSTLYVFLLGTDYSSQAGDALFGVASLTVQPGVGIVRNAAFPAFVGITAVPEPSELLLMMTGLGLVGLMVRRRKAAAA